MAAYMKNPTALVKQIHTVQHFLAVLAADSSYTNNINLKSFTKHFFKYKV